MWCRASLNLNSLPDLYTLSELPLCTHAHKHMQTQILIAAGHMRTDPRQGGLGGMWELSSRKWYFSVCVCVIECGCVCVSVCMRALSAAVEWCHLCNGTPAQSGRALSRSTSIHSLWSASSRQIIAQNHSLWWGDRSLHTAQTFCNYRFTHTHKRARNEHAPTDTKTITIIMDSLMQLAAMWEGCIPK